MYGTGTLKKADKVKKVAVIGGGPAGLKAAEILARRWHRVSIYEEKEGFGGQVNIAARIPNREEIKEIVRYMRIQVENLGVDIHLGEKMNVESVKGLEAEVIIVATGSRPAEAEGIEGYEQDNVGECARCAVGESRGRGARIDL